MSQTHTNKKTGRKVSPIVTLRQLMPDRPLRLTEAYVLAERQATRLHTIAKLERPPVPDTLITRLPHLRVERRANFWRSGETDWVNGAWRITLNASEPPMRQRFTLAHELKHVLDHPFVPRIYGSVPGVELRTLAESVCDYFAGCLLMPRAWVKRAYCDLGIQSIPVLSRTFAVSPTAMRVRLLQLGLIDPAPRCEPYYRDQTANDQVPELLTRRAS